MPRGRAARELLVTPLATNGRVKAALLARLRPPPRRTALDDRNRRVLSCSALLLAGFASSGSRSAARDLPPARPAASGHPGGRRRRSRHAPRLASPGRAGAARARLRRHGCATWRRTTAGWRSSPTATRLPGSPTTAASRRLLGRELGFARRDGRPLAVVLLDVDDFKRINESRGHPVRRRAPRDCAPTSLRSALARPRCSGARRRRRVRDRAARRRRRARVRAGRGRPHGASRPRPRCAARCAARPASPAIPTTPRARAPCCSLPTAPCAGQSESGRGALAPLRPRARLRGHRRAARGLRRPDRPPGRRAAGVPADRVAGERRDASASRRWLASTASPACRRRGGSRRPIASGWARRSRPRPSGSRWLRTGRPAGTFLAVNLSPSALASPEVKRAAARRPARRGDRDHRGGARARRGGVAAPPRPAAGAWSTHRRGRCRRGLRGAPAGDAACAPTSSSSTARWWRTCTWTRPRSP